MSYFELDIKPHLDGSSKASYPTGWQDTNRHLDIFKNNKGYLGLSDYFLGKIPEYDLKLDGFLLEKYAKVTDFISLGGLLRGFVISDRVRKILEEYRLPKHKFYPITFHQPSKVDKSIQVVEGYWWFYFELEFGKNVNFEKSEFDYERHRRSARIDLSVNKVNSLEEYEAVFRITRVAIRATTLVLNSNFDKNLDVWGTRHLTIESYFSSSLVQRFKKEKVTGYDLKETTSKLIFE